LEHTWITRSEYLGVSITLQNLVMIDAEVFFYNMNISIFGTFGCKMPFHAPKLKLIFLAILFP